MFIRDEYYHETAIESFIFSFGFLKSKIPAKEIFPVNVETQIFENKNLAISNNIRDFGKIVFSKIYKDFTEYFLQNIDKININVKKYKNYADITYLFNNISINFIDRYISENKFERIINNMKFYYENNKLVLLLKEIKVKFISKINTSKELSDKVLTLDIETLIDENNILIVFCISIYDGKNKMSFFLSDYKNSEELIIAALKSLMRRKYDKHQVYIHNMANFDIMFLLKYLAKLGSIQLVYHNDLILAVTFHYGKDNQYSIRFKDSYKLLLSSLMNLCKSFKVENSKILYPIFFANKSNLDYIGEVPDIKFFKNITLDEYNNYKDKFNDN
jgi:hypothetical protein